MARRSFSGSAAKTAAPRSQKPQEPKALGNHTTDLERVVQLFTLLLEGMSIRAASRVTGIHKTTICALLLTLGVRCAIVLDAKVRNLRPWYVQADEAWTFVQKKQKRLKAAHGITATSEASFGAKYQGVATSTKAASPCTVFIRMYSGPNCSAIRTQWRAVTKYR